MTKSSLCDERKIRIKYKKTFDLLAGRTREIQKKYWQLMKNTRWIHGAEEMPEYAVLEVVLENRIDFGAKEHMT